MALALKSLVTIALTLGVLSGCATFGRWGYETLPTWVMWRIQSYLDLDGEPKSLARRHLDALHEWHQTTQLAPLGTLLRQIRAQVEADRINERTVADLRDALGHSVQPLIDEAAPRIAEVARLLEPDQLARMRREFDKDNEKLRRERLQGSASERALTRSKRYVERAEFFLGDLNAAQRKLIRERSAQWPPVEQQWYEQRRSRQQDLLNLLEKLRSERPPMPTASRLMREHLNRYVQWREGPERDGGMAALAAGDTLLVDLMASITPRQRQHLLERLDDWIQTVDRLAARR